MHNRAQLASSELKREGKTDDGARNPYLLGYCVPAPRYLIVVSSTSELTWCRRSGAVELHEAAGKLGLRTVDEGTTNACRRARAGDESHRPDLHLV